MWRIVSALLLVASGAAGQTIQSWDGSGNGLLRGNYSFRNVIWFVGNQRGDLQGALAIYGIINFDGNGNYTFTCRLMDSRATAPQNCSATPIPGIYRVSAGGFARIESPLEDGAPLDGLVSNGILVASSTELETNDVLIAAQVRSEAATAATLNGRFWTGAFHTPSANVTDARDSLFPLNFDGAGSAGAVEATGYIGSNGTLVTQ